MTENHKSSRYTVLFIEFIKTMPNFTWPNLTVPQFPFPNLTVPKFPCPNFTLPGTNTGLQNLTSGFPNLTGK